MNRLMICGLPLAECDSDCALSTCVRLRFVRPRGLNAARGFEGGASSAAIPVSFSSAILY